MKILYLGCSNSTLATFLSKENDVTFTQDKITLKYVKGINPDIVISYRYRYIISADIVTEYSDKILNLHISYLPYNRGASPCFWSIVDNTKKGVTIHMIDEGLDTGDILYQSEINPEKSETLRQYYNRMNNEIQNLFILKWHKIKNLNFIKQKQDNSKATLHTVEQTRQFMAQLELNNKWDTTIEEVMMKTDEQLIDEIQRIRTKNNTHWMDVVRLAFRLAPEEAREIFKNIKECDQKINELLKELADND